MLISVASIFTTHLFSSSHSVWCMRACVFLCVQVSLGLKKLTLEFDIAYTLTATTKLSTRACNVNSHSDVLKKFNAY